MYSTMFGGGGARLLDSPIVRQLDSTTVFDPFSKSLFIFFQINRGNNEIHTEQIGSNNIYESQYLIFIFFFFNFLQKFRIVKLLDHQAFGLLIHTLYLCTCRFMILHACTYSFQFHNCHRSTLYKNMLLAKQYVYKYVKLLSMKIFFSKIKTVSDIQTGLFCIYMYKLVVCTDYI